MAKTRIEWTDETWNPVTGCTKVSVGCKHCYAERMALRLEAMGSARYANGFEVTLHPDVVDLPRRWKRPRRIFVNSMSDLFHPSVPSGFVMRCWHTMGLNGQHTYQVLTKRPERMREFVCRWADVTGEDWELHLVRGPEATRTAHPSPRGQLFAEMLESMGTPPPGYDYPTFDWDLGMLRWPSVIDHIWLGVSVENADVLDRIDHLRATPAAVRFLSVEPLIGPLPRLDLAGIDWVIVGGESGPGARPMHPDWVRAIRDRCIEQGVAFFFKQMIVDGRMVKMPELDGRTWDEFPEVAR